MIDVVGLIIENHTIAEIDAEIKSYENLIGMEEAVNLLGYHQEMLKTLRYASELSQFINLNEEFKRKPGRNIHRISYENMR